MSKPDLHGRSTSIDNLSSDTESVDRQNNLPKFMQHLFLFPNFEKLGHVYVRRLTENIWEHRQFYLWDNYLFETIPHNDDPLPLGYANLSGGEVVRRIDKKLKKSTVKHQPEEPGYAIKMSFLITSVPNSKKIEVILCGRDRTSTDALFQKFDSASKIGVNNMYEYDSNMKPLGVGRYARVIRAVNKHLREVIHHSHSSSSFTSTHDLSQSQPHETEAGQCALKLVNKMDFWNQVNHGQERKDTLVREVLAQCHILNSLVHSSASGSGNQRPFDEVTVSELELPIVSLNGMLETRDEFVMDMELMHSGDLFEKLVEHGTSFKEIQVKHITIQLVQAVALCQANGVAHRDIKLSNITFPEKVNRQLASHLHDRDRPMQIKLADFGMAGFVNQDGYLWGRCGTPGYVAPEIFRSGVREGYTVNVDMFSLGVAVFTLLSGYEPFSGDDIQQIIESNKIGYFDLDGVEWKAVSDDAKDFVRRAMSLSPKNRLTIHEALDHPWLAEYGGTMNYPPKYASSDQQKKCVIS